MKVKSVKYGGKRTPDGYFLVVIPIEVLELLDRENPDLLISAIIEYAGLEVFIKVKSRKKARKVAERAELILSRLHSFNENS